MGGSKISLKELWRRLEETLVSSFDVEKYSRLCCAALVPCVWEFILGLAKDGMLSHRLAWGAFGEKRRLPVCHRRVQIAASVCGGRSLR